MYILFELILDNNRTFYWQVALFRSILSDDSMKQHTEIVNIKYEDNDFAINPM